MAWGAMLGSVVKGGAKKIAANKLLNRKKKPQKPQAGGEEQEKGGPLAIRPTTPLVASPAGALAKLKIVVVLVVKEELLRRLYLIYQVKLLGLKDF